MQTSATERPGTTALGCAQLAPLHDGCNGNNFCPALNAFPAPCLSNVPYPFIKDQKFTVAEK